MTPGEIIRILIDEAMGRSVDSELLRVFDFAAFDYYDGDWPIR